MSSVIREILMTNSFAPAAREVARGVEGAGDSFTLPDASRRDREAVAAAGCICGTREGVDAPLRLRHYLTTGGSRF